MVSLVDSMVVYPPSYLICQKMNLLIGGSVGWTPVGRSVFLSVLTRRANLHLEQIQIPVGQIAAPSRVEQVQWNQWMASSCLVFAASREGLQ